MTKLIAFDIDGTLVNSWLMCEEEIISYSNENDLPVPCIETIKINYAAHHEIDFKWGVELHDQKQHLYNVFERVDSTIPPLFEGTLPFLEELKRRNYTLGIVTAKASEPMFDILDHYELNDTFSGIRTSCDENTRGEKRKPAPDQLLSLAKELNFAPSETIMIGDTTMDMEMGANSGAYSIGVTWGNHCVDLLTKAGANKIIDDDFDELLQHIIDIS